jgi:glucose 1-dehydrogenase
VPFALKPPAARLLDGRRALVTGAASGIGAGVAQELASHGAAVAIDHLPADSVAAQALAETIQAGGGQALAIAMDVTDEAQVRAGFAAAAEAFGGSVDLLVNNAGIETRFPLVDMPLDAWRALLDVNLTGCFLCAREAARGLIAAGRAGVIVNMSSVHEQIPWREFSHYCAAKGGMRLWAQSIAHELAEHRIRVVNVAPGAIETPLNQAVLDDPQQRAAVDAEIPLGRWGKVADVARAVAWLGSEQADYVTGTTLFVDGGMTLYPNFV